MKNPAGFLSAFTSRSYARKSSRPAVLCAEERTREELVTIMHQLHQVITVVPQDEYERYMERAKKISPDEKDVMYVALALKMKCGIWSNDGRLKEQSKVTICNTKELLDQLNM